MTQIEKKALKILRRKYFSYKVCIKNIGFGKTSSIYFSEYHESMEFYLELFGYDLEIKFCSRFNKRERLENKWDQMFRKEYK